MLLSKGFEVEVYTGQPDGTIVGLSDRITTDMDGFIREPDSRNVEFITSPCHQCKDSIRTLLQMYNGTRAVGDAKDY